MAYNFWKSGFRIARDAHHLRGSPRGQVEDVAQDLHRGVPLGARAPPDGVARGARSRGGRARARAAVPYTTEDTSAGPSPNADGAANSQAASQERASLALSSKSPASGRLASGAKGARGGVALMRRAVYINVLPSMPLRHPHFAQIPRLPRLSNPAAIASVDVLCCQERLTGLQGHAAAALGHVDVWAEADGQIGWYEEACHGRSGASTPVFAVRPAVPALLAQVARAGGQHYRFPVRQPGPRCRAPRRAVARCRPAGPRPDPDMVSWLDQRPIAGAHGADDPGILGDDTAPSADAWTASAGASARAAASGRPGARQTAAPGTFLGGRPGHAGYAGGASPQADMRARARQQIRAVPARGAAPRGACHARPHPADGTLLC